MTMSVASDTKRSNALDFVKIVATTIILFHHYQQDGQVRFSNHLNFFYNSRFDWGFIVELFFMISGFVMYHYCDGRLSKTSFASFIGKRCQRLLPPMTIAAVAYFVLGYVYQQVFGKPFYFSNSVNIWGTIISALGLQEGWGLYGWNINNPTWYVSVLLLCYCWFYVITRIAQKYRFPLVYAYLIMLIISFSGIQLPLFIDNAPRGYKCFFFGLLLAIFYHHFELNQLLSWLCFILMCIVVLFIVRGEMYTDVRMSYTYLFCPSLILLSQTSFAKKVFSSKIWPRLSAISYHVYVWHNVLQLLLYIIDTPFWTTTRPVFMYLFALLAWLLGAVSWWLFEGPVGNMFIRILNRIFVKRDVEHNTL